MSVASSGFGIFFLSGRGIEAKASEGVRWMPWLSEAMKDVTSCDKPGLGANDP